MAVDVAYPAHQPHPAIAQHGQIKG
jgi:hypothetical protein